MTSEIQAVAAQIQPQTLEDKLIAFEAMAKDLVDNHWSDLGEVIDIENLYSFIKGEICLWNEHQNDLEHAGDDTPEQTQRKYCGRF